MAQRRGFRRGSSVRRPSFWLGNSFQALPSIAGVATTANTIVAEVDLEQAPNPTLVRVRGSWGFNIAGLDGSGVLTVGMMLVNAAALAAGVASLPTPFTEIGSDWLWWDSVGIDNVGTVGDGTVLAGQRTIDSKAMRKVKNNTVLVLVTEISGIGAAAGIATISGVARVLFKR